MHEQINHTTRPLNPTGPAGPNLMSNIGIGKFSRTAILAVFAMVATHTITHAQVMNAAYEADYEASGFVAPAGMPSPEAYYSQVEQASFFGPSGPIAARPFGCDGGCGPDGCDGGCGPGCGMGDCGMGGYGGGCGGCGTEGCQSCGGLTNLRYGCLFCRGSGCSVCQSIGRGYLLAGLRALLPYSEAGICAQRWYDFSAEAMFLGHTADASNTVLTTRGVGGTPVLRASDADDNGLEAGTRLSAAFIFGPGSNIEATYMGGQEWGGSASVNDAGANLFSFMSDFGALPAGNPQPGFDDTDRSLTQQASTFSTFHSAEINYRRRTVEQYCRFQGSWLAGLRYVRFDSDFGYDTIGEVNNAVPPQDQRFFNYRNDIDNKLFGPQAGFDLWWNVVPGINVGFGAKGAWMDNNIDRRTRFAANSLGPGATPLALVTDDGINRSTLMGEFEATLLYRISHSWTLKTQYYLMTIDDIAQGFDLSGPTNIASTPQVFANDPIQTDSLTIQGFSVGAEYIW